MYSVSTSEVVRVLRACRIRSSLGVSSATCTRSVACFGNFRRSTGGPVGGSVFSPGPYVTPGLCLTGETFRLFFEHRVG